jgi:hypothetical protein
MPKKWREVFKIHPAAELLPRMKPEELQALAEDIKENGLQHPIILWTPSAKDDPNPESFVVLDGISRLDAAELAGLETIRGNTWLNCPPLREQLLYGHQIVQEIVLGKSVRTKRIPAIEPYAYVLSANIRRRHLTPEETKVLIKKLKAKYPDHTNRQLAAMASVHPSTVTRALEETAHVADATAAMVAEDQRTVEEKLKAVVKAHKAHPEASHKAIARMVNVSDKFVAKHRYGTGEPPPRKGWAVEWKTALNLDSPKRDRIQAVWELLAYLGLKLEDME